MYMRGRACVHASSCACPWLLAFVYVLETLDFFAFHRPSVCPARERRADDSQRERERRVKGEGMKARN